MRSYRTGVFITFLLFGTPLWAQQSSSTATQPASDPQAIAVVQAAITALGGAAAITQPQSWTFQAQTRGPHTSGDISYVVSTDSDAGHLIAADGTAKPLLPIRSHFLPALVAAILLKEFTDPNFSLQYEGTGERGSKTVTVISFMHSQSQRPVQIWAFNSLNIPVEIDFRLPAEIGARQTFATKVRLSNYQQVSGVLYPFEIITVLEGGLSQLITLQTIAPSLSVVPNDFNGPGGDLR